jgi:hypothetical protein
MPIRTLTIVEWHATLENGPLAEVAKFWHEIGFTP